MAEKKYIDPSLKKRNENGTNLDSRAMSKRRGRKKTKVVLQLSLLKVLISMCVFPRKNLKLPESA